MARRTLRHSRRRFLRGGLALAGSGFLAGCGLLAPPNAQPPRLARVGYLALAPQQADDPLLEAFADELRSLGHIEGRDYAMEYRDAQGDRDRLPSVAAELVGLAVDV